MKKFFSKIAQRAFALAISIMVVTNTLHKVLRELMQLVLNLQPTWTP